jgi:N-acetylmuramoyl-L-alanine amidase
MNGSAFRLSLILAAAVVLSGCAARLTPYEELYASLKEEWRIADWRVLENRTIVIDPGHGGAFDGATGPDSLREADANLGVALYLWGLLKEAGADVHLTRTTDRDFLPEGSEELAGDLENRTEEANRHEPEVFISIHHNSNLALDREKNGVEIYYRGDDPDASLELAGDVHLHLARNLGIEKTEILPGNYYVLRNSTARAAILGEASYISHPVVEERLKLSNKQRLEAEAYFLGLVSYFSRGVPSFGRHTPENDTLSGPGEISFEVVPGGGVPIDPATAKVAVNGYEEIAVYDPLSGMLSYALEPNLPNGPLAIRAKIRSTHGATALSRERNLLLSRPAAHILALPPTYKAGDTVSLRLKVLDALGQPVADGTPVRAAPLGTEEAFEGTCENGIFTFDIRAKEDNGAFAVRAAEMNDTIIFHAMDRSLQSHPIRVIDRSSKNGIPFPIAIVAGGETLRGDAHGWLQYDPSCEDRSIIVAAAGYRPYVFTHESDGAAPSAIELSALLGSVLHGRRIVLDPAGGGADDGGRGKNELRGASVNREVARRICDLCIRCGAHASLARTGEETLSPAERIYRVNRFAPDLAISISHGSRDDQPTHSCTILHYPGSDRGALLALRLRDELAGLPPCEEYSIEESSRPFLTQTSCPACEFHSGSIEDESSEAVFSNPRYAGLAAERIFTAIAHYLSDESWSCSGLRIAVLSMGKPLAGATVSIDQTFTLTTGNDGAATFRCLDAGTHLITITSPEGHASVFLRDLPLPPPSELVIDIDTSPYSAAVEPSAPNAQLPRE